ncbi:hypothetical protein BJ912DRAFT_1043233 [Pholiota molesta]|nr:hypothetical protein BJ912DRAFT_1043233 [Pholiota molesta]
MASTTSFKLHRSRGARHVRLLTLTIGSRFAQANAVGRRRPSGGERTGAVKRREEADGFLALSRRSAPTRTADPASGAGYHANSGDNGTVETRARKGGAVGAECGYREVRWTPRGAELGWSCTARGHAISTQIELLLDIQVPRPAAPWATHSKIAAVYALQLKVGQERSPEMI